MEGLIEGRVIHYTVYNERCLAGMIIGIGELLNEYNAAADESRENIPIADLVVFTNMKNVNGIKNFGVQFHQEVEYSENKEVGTWHWPERN